MNYNSDMTVELGLVPTATVSIERFKSFCPDEKTLTLLSKIEQSTPGVNELEFDGAAHVLSNVLPPGIEFLSARKSLAEAYSNYLDKIYPNWEKRKEILYSYPGINQPWQLIDPYYSVIRHINRPDADGIVAKYDYGVSLIFPRSFEERASVMSQAGKDYLGFEELYVSLVDAGYIPQIFNAEQKGSDIRTIIDEMAGTNTKVAGINLTVTTARDGLKLAAAIKEADPAIKIFLGGHHISLAVQEEDIFSLPEFNNVDGVIVGKGDLTLPLVIDTMRRNESVDNIPDIVYRENRNTGNIINAWRAVPLSKYPIVHHVQLKHSFASNGVEKNEKRSARISSTEGCIGNCSYCTSVKLYDRNYNPRAIVQVVDEIEFLQQKYGINTIYFNDDIFIKPGKDGMKRANEFCDELEKRGLKIKYRPLLRPDSIPFTPEGDMLFNRLKMTGMNMSFVGFESASTDMLELFDKMVDLNNYKKFVKRARKEGVALQLGFIAWHPLMSLEDAQQNFRFLYEADELYSFSVMVQKLDVFPGTRDKQKLISEGLLAEKFNCLSDSQNYSFKDRFVGELADSLNQVYREDEKFAEFDKTISRLHLTVVPDLISGAEDLLKTKPSVVLATGIELLKKTHNEAMNGINQLLFDFIKEHLNRYGEGINLNEALWKNLSDLMPKLLSRVQVMQDVIDYLNNTCLRSEGEFEQKLDKLFTWEQFPERIDRNIAVSSGGIPLVFNNLLFSATNFRVITDLASSEEVIKAYPQLEQIIAEHGVFIDHNAEIKIDNLAASSDDLIVGLGGGLALDVAKQVANRFDKGMVLIPTILSTNTFSTPITHPMPINSNAFLFSGMGRIPDFVMIDQLFLSEQDRNLNRLGFGDIAAAYSAGHDWQMAIRGKQSKYNFAVDEERQNLLKDISRPVNLADPSDVVNLAKLLTRLSYCTFVDGVGSNPASGSEKIFSTAALQRFRGDIDHGNMMMLGSLIMTYLQGRDVQYISRILKNVGFDQSLSSLNLDRKRLTLILMNAKQISIQKGRKTILDKYQLDDVDSKTIVDDLIQNGLLTD